MSEFKQRKITQEVILLKLDPRIKVYLNWGRCYRCAREIGIPEELIDSKFLEEIKDGVRVSSLKAARS